MIRSRIRRLEHALPEPLSLLSEAELEARIAVTWDALCGGTVAVGDVEGLIEHLGSNASGEVDAQYADFLRRHAWMFEHQISPE